MRSSSALPRCVTAYRFAALIARYMILQGVTAFAQSFQMLTYGWLLQIAKLGDPALRHLSVF